MASWSGFEVLACVWPSNWDWSFGDMVVRFFFVIWGCSLEVQRPLRNGMVSGPRTLRYLVHWFSV